ncbi:MAG: BamA/TamA family outer membrane protein [Leptolyngbyaceae cyanobacterium SM1_3_5]|nr:BamA/TamA family outer membrane protein [Leptolyngbyaceae cyanobacterium SM1_3_5]
MSAAPVSRLGIVGLCVLGWSVPAWSQTAVPAGNNERISEIQVRYVDSAGEPVEGLTRPFVITREFELQPGAVYTAEAAQAGVDRLIALDAIRDASLSLEPSIDPTQAVLVVTVEEADPVFVGFRTAAPQPSALQGPFQRRVGGDESTGFAVSGSVQLRNVGGNDQNLALNLRGGENVLDGEIIFRDPWIGSDRQRTGYAVNFFNQRSQQTVFTGGDREVDLPGGDDPIVHRLGGGVQVTRAIEPDLSAALGLSYQRVSVRDGIFSGDSEPVDELGNALAVSDSGQDDLLTLNFAAQYDRRNDPLATTSGYRLRFGVDQAIPIGESNIAFTRLSGSYLQYFPVPLFGFADGNRTLVLSSRIGTILGDVPPYEAFNIEAGSVRGYGGDGLGAGSSFFEVATEYRFPIANFRAFDRPIGLGGALFVGYATDLGTADEVIGIPSIARDQPGSGLGYGIGLRATTPIGLVRLEFGLSDEGSEVILSTGDRF